MKQGRMSKKGKGKRERSDDEDCDQSGEDEDEQALQSDDETKMSQKDRQKARKVLMIAGCFSNKQVVSCHRRRVPFWSTSHFQVLKMTESCLLVSYLNIDVLKLPIFESSDFMLIKNKILRSSND